jgi:hypothetical protein
MPSGLRKYAYLNPGGERRGDDLVVGLHGGVTEGLAADAIGTDEQFTHLANHRGTGLGG